MTGSDPHLPDTAVPGGDDAEGVVIRSEERLRVATETVPVGRVRVRKYLVTEQRTITVPVIREEIEIDYEDIAEHDQVPDGSGPLASEELELIRHEERIVVTKQVVAVERVRLTRRVVTVDHTVAGQVRREVVELERPDAPVPVEPATG